MIYLSHGGGMVSGKNRSDILEVLDWAEELRAAVVSVEYRLAPETPHPGPIEDCYAGLTWLAAHHEELGIDPDQVVIAGLSAGGGLTAALALLARDRDGPAMPRTASALSDARRPQQQPLLPANGGARNLGIESPTRPVGRPSSVTGTPTATCPRMPLQLGRPRVASPPAFIDVGSAETFRDEDIAYASRIWAAGGVAELHVWPGGFHGYYSLAPDARISSETRAARLAWLRRLLNS